VEIIMLINNADKQSCKIMPKQCHDGRNQSKQSSSLSLCDVNAFHEYQALNICDFSDFSKLILSDEMQCHTYKL
jgi:hypothetical protein